MCALFSLEILQAGAVKGLKRLFFVYFLILLFFLSSSFPPFVNERINENLWMTHKYFRHTHTHTSAC